ncbi:MAG: long-chain fatty acid--CoA ligase [Chloroflexi bacterium]|nr:long-chain fatty acid--CoA ligase [Chloroflexota bacterium]
MSLDERTLDLIRAARAVNGVPGDRYKIPFRNIRQVLSLHARVSPEKTFLIHYDAEGNREELSYAEFNARVHQTAHLLRHDLDVRRGDRVATIGYNHSDLVIIYFACWIIGAAVAPQNVAEDDRRIAFILRNSRAVVCFVRQEYLERARQIIYGTEEGLGAPNIRRIIQIGGQPDGETLFFHQAVQNLPNTFFGDDPEPALEDEALLVYTSGTTGAPKGVVLTQYNLLVDAQGIAQWQGFTGNQRMMCVLPIHHVNGIVVTLVTPALVGGSVVLNRQFSSAHFWERICKERVQIVSVVPTLLQFCLEYADQMQARGAPIWGEGLRQQDLSAFRHIICGAGTLAMALVKAFEERFGVRVLHGYGLSETTCYSCFLPIDLSWEEHKHWLLDFGYPSIGCPIEPNEMAIFSADGSGQPLGPGERGEICIRGHNVMKYYDQRPDANAETFRFGWFRSGDEGFYEVDARGRQFFFITGRIKELINRGGVKFSPFDIEEVLLEIPGVKVGLAIAFRNDYYGEEVGAYVVPEEGAALDAEAILDHCRRRLTFEKAPKVVVFGTDIPVTSTGKYQRLRLQERFAAWEHTQFKKP